MALTAGTLFEVNSAGPASNAGSGGFNPRNANFLTDLTFDSNTANTASPVASSASYAGLSADDEHWLFIKAGTNMFPGFYQIASVSGGKFTLRAGIGEALLWDADTSTLSLNTVAGCASVGTPTGGTFGIDYSQSTTARYTYTDLTTPDGDAAAPTLTSAANPFHPVMVGNLLKQTGGTGFTVSWFEIVSVSVVTATMDRAIGSNGVLTGGTGNCGGAISLGSTDDAVFELTLCTATAASRIFIKGNATYTISGSISVSGAADGDNDQPLIYKGYNSKRTDVPNESQWPILDFAANTLAVGNSTILDYINIIGTPATLVTTGSSNLFRNTKIKNISTTAGRIALLANTSTPTICVGCELISYRGDAYRSTTSAALRMFNGCYIHHSVNGIATQVDGQINVNNTIIESCITAAHADNGSRAAGTTYRNCTIYGGETPFGTGFSFSSGGRNNTIENCILYGLTTGVSNTIANTANFDNYNNYNNNTTDVSNTDNWQKGPNDIAVDPEFTDVVERSGSTATTTSGNHLVQSGADFVNWGVTPGRDYLRLVSKTGATAGIYGIASVDSATQITTDVTLTANATSDGVWQIVTGHNFLPTGAV